MKRGDPKCIVRGGQILDPKWHTHESLLNTQASHEDSLPNLLTRSVVTNTGKHCDAVTTDYSLFAAVSRHALQTNTWISSGNSSYPHVYSRLQTIFANQQNKRVLYAWGKHTTKGGRACLWCVTTTGQRAVCGVPRTWTPPSNVRPVVTCRLHVPSKIKHVERACEMHGSSSAYVSVRSVRKTLRRTKRFATYAVQWAGAETFTYHQSCRNCFTQVNTWPVVTVTDCCCCSEC